MPERWHPRFVPDRDVPPVPSATLPLPPGAEAAPVSAGHLVASAVHPPKLRDALLAAAAGPRGDASPAPQGSPVTPTVAPTPTVPLSLLERVRCLGARRGGKRRGGGRCCVR
jgi:hypothetical protein